MWSLRWECWEIGHAHQSSSLTRVVSGMWGALVSGRVALLDLHHAKENYTWLTNKKSLSDFQQCLRNKTKFLYSINVIWILTTLQSTRPFLPTVHIRKSSSSPSLSVHICYKCQPNLKIWHHKQSRHRRGGGSDDEDPKNLSFGMNQWDSWCCEKLWASQLSWLFLNKTRKLVFNPNLVRLGLASAWPVWAALEWEVERKARTSGNWGKFIVFGKLCCAASAGSRGTSMSGEQHYTRQQRWTTH